METCERSWIASVTFDRGDLNRIFGSRQSETLPYLRFMASRYPYIGVSQRRMATRYISNVRLLTPVKLNVSVRLPPIRGNPLGELRGVTRSVNGCFISRVEFLVESGDYGTN
jgi:hypothetical protein